MPEAVVFLSASPAIGGAERSLQEIILELRSRGRSCILVAPAGSRLADWATSMGVDHYTAEFGTLLDGNLANALRRLLRFRRLARHLERRHAARVFHSNTRQAFNFLAFLPSRYTKVAHHRDAIPRRINRVLYPRMDANVFITRFNFRRCGQPSNGRVILNAGAIACDLPPVAPPDTAIRMAMFARFEWFKGHRLALAACEVLGRRGVDCTLDLWGAPHGETEEARLRNLQEYATERGLRVAFRGFHACPSEVMRDYHAILNPSRDEPFGRVPVEGFSLGVPVVSHASGGTLEIYSGFDDYAPFLFHDYTPEALADCIGGLLPAGGGRQLYADALPRLQNDVQRRFDVARVADELEVLFTRRLSRTGGEAREARGAGANGPGLSGGGSVGGS